MFPTKGQWVEEKRIAEGYQGLRLLSLGRPELKKTWTWRPAQLSEEWLLHWGNLEMNS
jgi:hypothetical protein